MTDTNTTATDTLPPRDHNNPPSLLDAETLLRSFGNAEMPGTYSSLADDVGALLADIRSTAPEKIETEHENGIIAAHMESLRKTIKTVNNHHEAEKAPYLTAGRACDQFFFGFRDRLAKARDILQARGNDYTARKVAEERAERNRLALIEQQKAEAARREAARLAQEEADRRAAAERARKPENIAAHEAAAEQIGGQVAVAQVDAMIAASAAENAALATMASSADIARTRHESGHLSTAKQVGYVQIVDDSKLDKEILWSLIDDDVKLRALKAWAKMHKYKKQMDGAIIEMRDAADYR